MSDRLPPELDMMPDGSLRPRQPPLASRVFRWAVIVATGRIASLYVNNFNSVARAAYDRVGFAAIGNFATVLLD